MSVECMGFIEPETGIIITDDSVDDRVNLFKKAMSIGFYKVEQNEAWWRRGDLNNVEYWWMPDDKKANGYGARFAYGLSLIEVEDE